MPELHLDPAGGIKGNVLVAAQATVTADVGVGAAGMASAISCLVSSAPIAVPTSVGNGAAEGGRTALNAMLAALAAKSLQG